MEDMTEREMRVHLAWIEMQWDLPSRADYYIMQVAAEVRRTRVKNPASVHTDHLKLKFKMGRPREDRRTPEQRLKDSKSAWLGAAGILDRVKVD